MLADEINWVLPDLRAEAEARMSSTCTIAPAGTEPVTDPETGAVTFPDGEAVYSGPCGLRPAGTQGQTDRIGGAEAFTFDYVVSVPFAATGIREGMSCRIDSSPDADAVGIVLQVEQVARGEHITARRLNCSEVA